MNIYNFFIYFITSIFFLLIKAKYITLSRPSTAHLFSKGAQNQKEVLPSIVRAEVSKSVGLIYINGKVEGTGFRVGIKYILTCEHVIKNAKGIFYVS